MYKVIKLGLIVSFIFTLQACSSLRMLNPFGDKVSFVDPPKDTVLSEIDIISIKQNQSQTGLISQVKKSFSKANAGGSPYFKQVVIGDASVDVKASKVAYIDINVEKNQVFDQAIQEQRMQCPGKKLINTCSSDEAYYYKVNCTKRTAIVSAKLIATSGDGSVLATKDSTNTTDSTKCSDRSDTLESESSLLSKLLNTASLELVADFIPVHKQRPSDLIDESEEFEEADAKILSLASELAAKNDLVKADGLYKELLSRYPHHAGLVFNLGYVNHALGNFELAADYYSKALQLAGDESANEDFAEYAKEAQAWVNKGITQVKK